MSYCSADEMDTKFWGLGGWQDVESDIEGGIGNPPFDKDFIAIMLRRFEEGFLGSKTYCRIVLLPVGVTYKVTSHVESLTSEGRLLVSAPAGSFPFMNQQVFLSQDHLKSKPGTPSSWNFRVV